MSSENTLFFLISKARAAGKELVTRTDIECDHRELQGLECDSLGDSQLCHSLLSWDLGKVTFSC